MIKTRIITALAGIPVILFLIHMGSTVYFLFIVSIVFIGLQEYFALVTTKHIKPYSRTTTLLGTAMIFVFYFFHGASLAAMLLLLTGCAVVAYFTAVVFARRVENAVQSIGVSVLGLLYAALLPGHLLLLRSIKPHGALLTYLLFISTWSIDTWSLAGGLLLGRHKLNEDISPGKTVEGAVAGFLGGIVTVYLLRELSLMPFFIERHLSMHFISRAQAIILGGIIGVTGQLGDLAESLLKRFGQKKDSGILFPGHGGILDRTDSLVFNCFFLYYCVVFCVL